MRSTLSKFSYSNPGLQMLPPLNAGGRRCEARRQGRSACLRETALIWLRSVAKECLPAIVITPFCFPDWVTCIHFLILFLGTFFGFIILWFRGRQPYERLDPARCGGPHPCDERPARPAAGSKIPRRSAGRVAPASADGIYLEKVAFGGRPLHLVQSEERAPASMVRARAEGIPVPALT